MAVQDEEARDRANRRPAFGIVQDLAGRLLQDPLLLLILYGLVGLVAGWINSPDPRLATRWALYFLAVPVLGRVLLVGRDREAAARRARLAWNVLEGLAVGISLVILGLAFWKLGLWGMLLGGHLRWLAFDDLSHAWLFVAFGRNEVAVFAAIASLMLLTRLLHETDGKRAILWAVLLAPCALLLGVSQSVLPLGMVLVALPVVFLLGPRRASIEHRVGLAAGVVLGLASVVGVYLGLAQYIALYREKGLPILEIFTTVHTRTRIWHEAWTTWLLHPVLGWGFAAGMILVGALHDYPYVIEEAWLHAAIVGGIVGLALFVLAWASAWDLLRRKALGRRKLAAVASRAERVILAQAIPILLFLTLRTVPEDTAAMLNTSLVALVGVMVVGMGLSNPVEEPTTASARVIETPAPPSEPR